MFYHVFYRKVNGFVQYGHRWIHAAIIVSCLITFIYYNSCTQQRVDFDSEPATSQKVKMKKLPSIDGAKQQTSSSVAENHTGRENSIQQKKPRKLPVILPGGRQCDACLMGKQLISVQKDWICGQPRIGNKMFMLIPAITAAYEHNATLVLVKNDMNNKEDCEWSDLLQGLFEYFDSSAPLLPAKILRGWYNLGEPGFTNYTSNYYMPKDNYTVAGYRQSWRYVETASQQTAARQVFRFTSRYENFAVDTITKAKQSLSAKNAILVGIHMRIGDLLDKGPLDFGYVMARPDFYKAAIDKANQTLNSSDIILVVASDSPVKAKAMLSSNNITSEHKTHFLHGSAFEDFATLTKCDHTIISGGTYGWWAAWLAGGKTFYHASFSKPGSHFAEGFSNENFYFPDWIPVYTQPQEKSSAASSIPDVIY